VTPECHEPEPPPAIAPPAGGSSGSEPEGFGPRLRRERERRGISLDTIARSTKIKSSLLVGLERDDVSHWPSGIFRRAFMREYAAAIGLAPEPLVTEFLERFPDPEADSGGAPQGRDARPDVRTLRLTFDPDPAWTVLAALRRLAAAALDATLIALGAGVVAWYWGANAWMAGAILALAYYSTATALLGRSFASWLFRIDTPVRRRRVRAARPDDERSSRRVFDLASTSVRRIELRHESDPDVAPAAPSASAFTH
jgi:transcriptional regulator with XRE-family HTH domain